ncbi:MAG: hypothetical protein KGL39_04340 [Patescibacteria group bacterium]|nr:hypothetical protein [Patescibacteria group bacterium]
MLGYLDTCLKCGQRLVACALGPDTAPYLCVDCHQGWFVAELSEWARSRYRPEHGDFGLGTPAKAIRSAVEAELEEARTRGTSLREDQLPTAETALLKSVKFHPFVHPDFSAKVDAEIQRRGA